MALRLPGGAWGSIPFTRSTADRREDGLRWDTKDGRVNKALETVVIKTVAAFANSREGGTLLIGVTDAGEAIGLDPDYSALGDADRDRFELHLRNLFADAFGHAFTADKLRVTFPHVGDIEICQINVRPADHAVIVEAKDKNGVKTEKLYVRSGNSSPELPLSAVPGFVTQRFGGTSRQGLSYRMSANWALARKTGTKLRALRYACTNSDRSL